MTTIKAYPVYIQKQSFQMKQTQYISYYLGNYIIDGLRTIHPGSLHGPQFVAILFLVRSPKFIHSNVQKIQTFYFRNNYLGPGAKCIFHSHLKIYKSQTNPQSREMQLASLYFYLASSSSVMTSDRNRLENRQPINQKESEAQPIR